MRWLKTVANYLNEIAGVPNYKRYLIHFQKHHPGGTPLSEKKFYQKAIDEKYGNSSIRRCC
ncbi:YbdD/YjiX family protein [Shimazuella sp. AN120528]|uniref:YbdD/YjiX family protein n=1 Tax=Shimazuella soli TaxID=1892854 RepID=UPI001F10F703|nr:YbdD/YjiX family protein [Shimazuella soli]MCH5585442.1 YbdD/YjiX family protein [Shimazuella soli]